MILLFAVINLSYEYQNATHALSKTNKPKYDQKFKKLDYINSEAPKGGTLKLATISHYNKLNMFTLRGTEPVGISLLYDQLMESTADDPNTYYGLVAKKIYIAPSLNHLTIFLNKNIYFSNGIKLTAHHVKESLEIYRNSNFSKIKVSFKNIKSITVHDDHSLTVFLSGKNRQKTIFDIAKSIPLFCPDLKKQMVSPIGTGPYILSEANSKIILKRKKNYWAQDLPLKRFRHNFDEIDFEIYKDFMTLFEAFKKGEFDAFFDPDLIHFESINLRDPRFKKVSLHHNLPVPSYFLVLNSERIPDVNMRRCLCEAFDFDKLNFLYFNNKLKQPTSLFQNTIFETKFDKPKNSIDDILKKINCVQTKTFKIVLNTHDFDKFVNFYKYVLSRIGINLLVYYADPLVYQNIVNDGAYDLIISSMYNGVSPIDELKNLFGKDNIFRFYDEYLDKMICEKNLDINGIEKYLYNQNLYVGLYYMDKLNIVYRSDRIDFKIRHDIFIDIMDNGWSVKP